MIGSTSTCSRSACKEQQIALIKKRKTLKKVRNVAVFINRFVLPLFSAISISSLAFVISFGTKIFSKLPAPILFKVTVPMIVFLASILIQVAVIIVLSLIISIIRNKCSSIGPKYFKMLNIICLIKMVVLHLLSTITILSIGFGISFGTRIFSKLPASTLFKVITPIIAGLSILFIYSVPIIVYTLVNSIRRRKKEELDLLYKN